MFYFIILLFIVIPFSELAILIKISHYIGFWPTLGLQIITGIVGVSLARIEGFHTLQKIQNSIQRGIPPTGAVLDGVLIFLAGLVLLTPGLITDAIGFFVLIPPGRRLIRRLIAKKFSGPNNGDHPDENAPPRIIYLEKKQ